MRKIQKRGNVRDSQLAFFINQLDNMDPTLHQPLMNVSWGRDIKLRGNVTLANESTSFLRNKFGAAGTLSSKIAGKGPAKPWISANSTAIPGVSVDSERIVTPLRPLARQIDFTSIELKRSMLTGQSIDTSKTEALQQQYQLETDAMVYIGDTDVGALGLLNSTQVTSYTVAAGASGSTLWLNKTADEILADFNKLLVDTWNSGALAICPKKVGLPPAQFGYISTIKVSSAGNMSLLNYIAENCIAKQINGVPLEIVPMKYLVGIGSGNSDRMIAYTNEKNLLRFPMVPIQRETPYYQGITFLAPYVYGFGEVEFVYPETVRYADGI